MENSRLRSDSVMELASSYVMDNGDLHLKSQGSKMRLGIMMLVKG